MHRLSQTLVGLFTTVLTLGQVEINNTITDKHVRIDGTKSFLIPPKGFVGATDFQGFQELNSGSSILVAEMPGPYSESINGFDEQGLLAQGIVLKRKDEIMINGNQGFLLTTEQTAFGTDYLKYILVFGDANATYLISGMSPKDIAEYSIAIRESILSFAHDPELIVDPLATVPFSVDTENTKLVFGKNLTGMLLFTVDGKVPTESTDKTSFVVGRSLGNVQAVDQKLTALNRVNKMPYTDLKIDESQIKEITIDGVSGYEIAGEALDKPNGTKMLVYQVMLFTDNGYYILVGTSKSDYQENLVLFKKVARTFQRK